MLHLLQNPLGGDGTMAVYEDYIWLTYEGERTPGARDYFECISKIQALYDTAMNLISTARKKGTIIPIDDENLKNTNLIVSAPDLSVLSDTPEELRDKFDTVTQFFDDFDNMRKMMMGTKVTLADGLIWGFWRDSYGETCGLDEATEFDVQTSPSREGIPNYGTRHGYGDETPLVEWPLRSFEQTGVTYYVGAASFAEIDAVSRVPSYPNSIPDDEWARRALDPAEDDDQFQRPLDLRRMQDIQRFVRASSNRILNSVILYIPPSSMEGEDPSVMLQSPGQGIEPTLTIDIGKFLQRHDDGVRRTWQDNPYRDLRPIMILDGQHRTRGGATSPEGKNKRVPIVILPPDITLSEVARIFTEINTGSEELQKLLQLHLRHRFALASRKKEKDFRAWEPMNAKDPRRKVCRANRLSYELAAMCCSDEEGALHKRIRFMDVGSGGTNVVTNAQEFNLIASRWFSGLAPFGSEDVGLEEAYPIVSSYFRAWQIVVDRETEDSQMSWEDGLSRWYANPQKGTSGKPTPSYITMQIPFKAVLMTFPLAFELASKRQKTGNTPTQEDFIEVLKPLQHLDWNNIEILKTHYGTGKYSHLDLYEWFSWALQDYSTNGKAHPNEQAWNPDTQSPDDCLPGRGFFSPISSKLVQIHPTMLQGGLWPVPGDRIHFWSPLVPNACRVVEWQVSIDGEATPSEKRVADADGSLLTVPATRQLSEASTFTITAFWSRSQSGRLSPAGKSHITISKDEDGFIRITDKDGVETETPKHTEEIGALESLEEGDYLVSTNFGEGPLLPPPPPNSPRAPSSISLAPARFRVPWCSDCFHGNDCTAQHCQVRDRDIPTA